MSENDETSGKNRAEDNTPSPLSNPKKKGNYKAGPGRPKGQLNGEALKKTRNYQISLTQAVREKVNPDILLDWDLMVLQGKNPILLWDARLQEFRCEADPSPMATAPTLNDKRQSQQNLLNRGWGMAASTVNIEANIKSQTLAFGVGIDNASLAKLDPNILFAIRDNLASLFAPKTDTSDAIDAEFTELSPDSDAVNTNSPLLEGSSEPLSEDKED